MPSIKPYVVQCDKCHKRFTSDNPKTTRHSACRTRKKQNYYPKFKRQRSLALLRDKQTCLICGKLPGDMETTPHVIHINRRRSDNRLANLATVCNDGCYKEWFTRRIEIVGH